MPLDLFYTRRYSPICSSLNLYYVRLVIVFIVLRILSRLSRYRCSEILMTLCLLGPCLGVSRPNVDILNSKFNRHLLKAKMSYTLLTAYCDVLEQEYRLLHVQAIAHRISGNHGTNQRKQQKEFLFFNLSLIIYCFFATSLQKCLICVVF